MIMTGNLWKWPITPDKVFYELGDIVQVISLWTAREWL